MDEARRDQAQRPDRTEGNLFVGLDVKLGQDLSISSYNYIMLGGGGEI